MLFQLISDAIRYGDCHKTTMEMADFWLTEKQLVHKLFKVLVPRYENYTTSYTRMWKASQMYPTGHFRRSVLELKGNKCILLVSHYSFMCIKLWKPQMNKFFNISNIFFLLISHSQILVLSPFLSSFPIPVSFFPVFSEPSYLFSF